MDRIKGDPTGPHIDKRDKCRLVTNRPLYVGLASNIFQNIENSIYALCQKSNLFYKIFAFRLENYFVFTTIATRQFLAAAVLAFEVSAAVKYLYSPPFTTNTSKWSLLFFICFCSFLVFTQTVYVSCFRTFIKLFRIRIYYLLRFSIVRFYFPIILRNFCLSLFDV